MEIKWKYFCREQCAKERGQFCLECPPEINDFLAGLMGIPINSNPNCCSKQGNNLQCMWYEL